jgi:hypothetical protein
MHPPTRFVCMIFFFLAWCIFPIIISFTAYISPVVIHWKTPLIC